MKVSELIEHLKKVPQDFDVCTRTSGAYYSDPEMHFPFSKKVVYVFDNSKPIAIETYDLPPAESK